LHCLLWRERAGAQPQYPEPRVSTTMIHGVWIKSPIAAVAEIANVTSYGEQYVQQLPPPTAPDAHMLYW
jgi:hypothetical protein